MLCDIARICSESAGVSCIGARVLERICRPGGWHAGCIYVLDEDGSAQQVASVRCTSAEGQTDRALDELRDRLLDEVLTSGAPTWQRTEFDPGSGGAVSGMCAPISSDGVPIGAMLLISPSCPPPGDVVKRAIETVATQFAGVVERHHLDRLVARAAEEEQERIGRDLHDSISQELMSLALIGDGVTRRLRQQGSPEHERTERLASGLRRCIGGIRGIIEGLVPIDLEDTGLIPALQRLCRSTSEQRGVTCRASGEVEDLTSEVSRQLYFIAGEALRNAVKHADAECIEIRVDDLRGSVRVSVQDDGAGFRDRNTYRSGRGLTIMRHRAGLIDGVLNLKSEADRGTTVVCTAPKGRRGKD
jgi:signal transduction histidine kinase